MTQYYKAFNNDWICRDFQYEVGKTYKHDGDIKLCNEGFHAYENPFDCWSYYCLTDAKFALIETAGEIKDGDDDSKIVTAEINIKAELKLPDFIKASIDYLTGLTKNIKDNGDFAQVASSGDSAQVASSGYYAQVASSGDSAKVASSGDSAKVASSGDFAQVASSGDSAKVASSGYFAKVACQGENAVIASAGVSTLAKGRKGTWISLAEYVDGKCVGFSTGCVGKKKLKADTYYMAKGGKLVECER